MIAIGSRRNSTAGRGSGWAFGLRRNAMRDETQCCTSKLISDGTLRSLGLNPKLPPFPVPVGLRPPAFIGFNRSHLVTQEIQKGRKTGSVRLNLARLQAE